MPAKFGGTIKLEGADQYKSDLANINSNLKLLSKEMQENGKTAADLAQKTELYNQKVQAQKRYIADIEDALAKAKEKYGENSDEAQKWVTKLNNAKAVLVDMEKELKASQQELDEFSSKFRQTADKLSSVGNSLVGLGENMRGLSTAAGAAVAALGGIAVKSAAAADDLNTLSAVTGISTEELQKFAYASEMIDVSQETVTGSLRKLISNMQAAQSGTEKQAEAFKALRVEYEDANGKLRSNVDVFYEIIDALGKVENSTEADALAMTLFGKSAQELNPLIKGGADRLKELGAEAEAAGLIMSQDTLDGVNKLDDAIAKLKATASGDMNKLGAQIAPTLIPIVEDMTEGLQKLVDWLSKLDTKTIETGLKVAAFTAVLAPLLITTGKTVVAIGEIVGMLGKLKTALMALSAADAGLLAVTAAVAALDAAFVYLNAHVDDNNFAVNELNKTLAEQQRTYREAAARIDENAQAQKDELDIVERLVPRLEELSKKTDRTAEENAELEGIVKQLNKQFPDLGLAVDETTGAINKQVTAIEDLIRAQKKEIETAAAMEKWQAALKAEQGTNEARWSARQEMSAAYAALTPEEKRKLQYVMNEYNSGKYEVQAIDEIIDTLEAKDEESVARVKRVQDALKGVQLAESKLSTARGELSTAESKYRDLLSTGTMSGDAPHMQGGKAVGTADKELMEKVKRGLEVWKYRKERGIISEEEYYNELERIRDQYFEKDSEEWRKYDLEIYNGRNKINDAQTKAAEKAAAERTKIAEQEAKERAKLAEQEAKETQKAREKAYKETQAQSYAWISERVDRGDFGDYGTSAKESYERIYQRALEAYRNGVIDIDALADEADRIKAAKLQDYKSEKTKLANFIDDRDFYNDWDAVNTTEEKVLQKMLDNADRYYAEGILSYREYMDEVRQLNRSIYTAQATEQESMMSLVQERIDRQLSEKRAEIDAVKKELDAQVSDLRASYTAADRKKRLAELKEEIQDYSGSVTLKGREHLKSLQDERERLLREQEIENLQKKNNEIIEQLEAEYKAMELEKTSLLTKIADNTAEFAKLTAAITGIGDSVSGAVASTMTKIIQDNSVHNNYNTNNASQYIQAAQHVDVMAAVNALVRGLK